MDADGRCWDVNGSMKFDDIYYEADGKEPGKIDWLVDDTQIDLSKALDVKKLPKTFNEVQKFLIQTSRGYTKDRIIFPEQHPEYNKYTKSWSRPKGQAWGTKVTGYLGQKKEAGWVITDKRNISLNSKKRPKKPKFFKLPVMLAGKTVMLPERARVRPEPFRWNFPWFYWPPLRQQKSMIVWEETPACKGGKVMINYAGGVASQNGLRNGPTDGADHNEKIHTYHVVEDATLAKSKKYQEAAKKALCEVPPRQLKCKGARVPKCEVYWPPGQEPKPAKPKGVFRACTRKCGSLFPEPPPPTEKVLTFQLANQTVGGLCDPEPSDPNEDPDELPETKKEAAG
eukprot:TRINITY_DN48383_c0_g1_i1.p1 TRINITY_DN48383_c0_g1~~TRINITY_DN48383_c0_g1_i1.p1  ORF type:complete len:387 (+),score=70.50 TRINITY_DN48383_c0_g1_i1:140-1162(+)